jgi:FixJ family two-component response regulator
MNAQVTLQASGQPRDSRPEHMNDDMLPNIYIVDDDDAVRFALRLLVRSFGWRARAFSSAAEFLDALPGEAPDCVLLDLNMPGMNGAELQEKLVSQGVSVPVIVITGQKDAKLLARSRAAGARALLSKPVQDEELKTCIERVLNHQTH